MLVQIAFRGGRRAQPHRLIRLGNMKRVTVRVGKYGDGRYAKPPQRTNDSACNDAAINQDL